MVDVRARWVVTSLSGQPVRIDAVEERVDLVAQSEGRAVADATVERHRYPTTRVDVPLVAATNVHLVHGQSITVQPAAGEVLDVPDMTADEEWLMDGVTYALIPPFDYDQRVHVVRRQQEDAYADFWRR